MNKRRMAIIVLAAILVFFGVAAVFGLLGNRQPDEPGTFHSQLTGIEVSREFAERPVLAVIYDNSQEARSQTGLDSAGIVFEILTEGGITRYMALFQEDTPGEVGPVRSLRPYFVDIAMGFDVSVAHVGGSAQALELAQQRDMKSLNQFDFSEAYYRADDRPAPHNVYARAQNLRDLQSSLAHGRSEFETIPRSEEEPSSEPEAATITINFSTATYEAQFHYDADSNSYTRHLAASPHIDRATNQPITVKNVIVIRLPSGDAQPELINSGEALVFKNGSVQTARWQKTAHGSRIEILDNEDNHIRLNRGDTWVAVLPQNRPVNY